MEISFYHQLFYEDEGDDGILFPVIAWSNLCDYVDSKWKPYESFSDSFIKFINSCNLNDIHFYETELIKLLNEDTNKDLVVKNASNQRAVINNRKVVFDLNTSYGEFRGPCPTDLFFLVLSQWKFYLESDIKEKKIIEFEYDFDELFFKKTHIIEKIDYQIGINSSCKQKYFSGMDTNELNNELKIAFKEKPKNSNDAFVGMTTSGVKIRFLPQSNDIPVRKWRGYVS